MVSPQKRRGDDFERAVQDHLRSNGFPWCGRTRAGYARDHGDLHLVPGPAVIVQCKNVARLALPEWLSQLAEQVAEAGADHGVLVVKRRGVADPGRSYAVMELDAMARLLRAAGYGSELEVAG
ncbi:restriction endonuclease [Pseudonocardia asaccharolytica]|uniref:Restriction endonuclease type IV Mrr domain-containing protein n=1 Tax=Pseudonocardia asaccharolytica DSM 44247 = NBRC 16224 TaxID=1123024 RepID=A0A511CZG6_9PSEU|nr:restriction endonuclease [Pseudonocardia asaccharolytica]GEL17663.1 hypothetical protein PA7_15000 [Pseudonocardia asaccharolytica DSM 44247 = NBRC 16224]